MMDLMSLFPGIGTMTNNPAGYTTGYNRAMQMDAAPGATMFRDILDLGKKRIMYEREFAANKAAQQAEASKALMEAMLEEHKLQAGLVPSMVDWQKAKLVDEAKRDQWYWGPRSSEEALWWLKERSKHPVISSVGGSDSRMDDYELMRIILQIMALEGKTPRRNPFDSGPVEKEPTGAEKAFGILGGKGYIPETDTSGVYSR